jgi:hypothetical protein
MRFEPAPPLLVVYTSAISTPLATSLSGSLDCHAVAPTLSV